MNTKDIITNFSQINLKTFQNPDHLQRVTPIGVQEIYQKLQQTDCKF